MHLYFRLYPAKSVIRELPCIVYFDDFNDSIPQVIEVPLAETEALVGWAEIVNNVFKKTDKSLTVRKLPDIDENTRKSALADWTTDSSLHEGQRATRRQRQIF